MISIKDESQMAEVADLILDSVRGDIGKKAIIIALEGPLGAGKTALTKVLMNKLGILDQVVSPTYVLHIPYETIDHLDVYRLETKDEFRRLHIENMTKEKHVVIIEWADKFEDEVKQLHNKETCVIWVKIGYGGDESERTVELTQIGR